MTLPLYRGADAALSADPRQGHAGLRFERLFDAYDPAWEIGDTKKQWLDRFAAPTGDANALERYSLSQTRLIQALGGRHGIFRVPGRFVAGTGYPHPVENGLAWHPVLGVPYLSGSAVKGLLRTFVEAWSFEVDEAPERARQLLRWFGSDHKDPKQRRHETATGDLILFDAVPTGPVPLRVDIMTPHGGKWYELGGKITDPEHQPSRVPADWNDPNPIPYLVAEHCSLLFGIAPRTPEAARTIDLNDVMECLRDALDWLGAGAKTALGYGRMVPDDKADLALKVRIDAADLAGKRAALSDEQRQLLDLRQQLDQDRGSGRQDPGGPLMQSISGLLQDARGWPDADRESLAVLAEAAYAQHGWGKGAKKKQRKQAIADLRAGANP